MAVSRRILLIEDDTDGRDGLCAVLSAMGHRVSSTDSGGEGIVLAVADAPELLIVDIGLHDMDGCDAIRRIRRQLPADAQPFIIAYSGYHAREKNAREAGCDAFVLKPSLEELEAWITGLAEHAGHKGPRSALPGPTRRSRTDIA
jgi:CheY-like chemotaxis protein